MNKTTWQPPRQADLSSTSMTATTDILYDWGFPDPPSVYYTQDAWDIIAYLVNAVETEVGWLGLVDILDDGNYLITDIYVPEQTVNGTETDITAETLCNLVIELEENNKESEKLFYWGHSHVNMGVSPSTQDEIQIEEFLENGCKQFIRGIYNKRGASKVDVYDVQNNCIHQCVRHCIQPTPMGKAIKSRLDKLIKNNIKKSAPKVYSKSWNAPSLGQTPPYKVTAQQSQQNIGYYYDDYEDDRDLLNDPFGWREH